MKAWRYLPPGWCLSCRRDSGISKEKKKFIKIKLPFQEGWAKYLSQETCLQVWFSEKSELCRTFLEHTASRPLPRPLHTHTHWCSHSYTPTYTHILTLTCTLVRAHIHTRTRAHFTSALIRHAHTHTLVFTYPQTHTHLLVSHSYSLILTHARAHTQLSHPHSHSDFQQTWAAQPSHQATFRIVSKSGFGLFLQSPFGVAVENTPRYGSAWRAFTFGGWVQY